MLRVASALPSTAACGLLKRATSSLVAVALCTAHRLQHHGGPPRHQQPRRDHYAPKQSNNDQLPIKDRSPPKAYDPQNPKRRLAVLVDASKVDADVFCRSVEPILPEVGVPVLIRIFDHHLSKPWKNLTAGHLSAAAEDAAKASAAGAALAVPQRTSMSPTIEWFRVERFIPISMQMAADAQHIFDFRDFNRIEAVSFVCSELDRPYYEATLLQRLKGKGFNQYLYDEMGLAMEMLEDGRSRDGAPTSHANGGGSSSTASQQRR